MGVFWGVEIKNGIVTYDDISHLGNDFLPLDDIFVLKEDMLQIAFSGEIVVDIGWRPSFDEHGKFHVVAVRDGDWDAPIAAIEAGDVAAARAALAKIIASLD